MPEKFKIISSPLASGSAYLKHGNTTKIRLNLKLEESLAETDVLKVILKNEDTENSVYCGIAETRGRDLSFLKDVEKSDFIPDTVEIIRKNVFTEETSPYLKISFKEDVGVSSEIDDLKKRLDTLNESDAYREFLNLAENLKSPVQRAEEILKSLHDMRASSPHDKLNEKCMAQIRDFAKNHPKTQIDAVEDFVWYKVPAGNLPCVASSFEHILTFPDASACVKVFGYYVLGIKNCDNIVSVAIPMGENTPHPLSHLDDCASFIKSTEGDLYCCVGISFEPDGQYFISVN